MGGLYLFFFTPFFFFFFFRAQKGGAGRVEPNVRALARRTSRRPLTRCRGRLILAGLRARNASQAFLTWVESWLGRRSYHVGTLAADVVPQGDPMSPWLFAIAIDYGLAAVQPYGVSLTRSLAPAPTEAEFAANPVQFDPGDPHRRTDAVGFADDNNLIGGSRNSLITMFRIL
jgi:hypothetical protein